MPTPPPDDSEPVTPASNFSATMPAGTIAPNVIEALQRGNKIEAIRLAREQTGMGLKEAKDAVDAYEKSHPDLNAHAHAQAHGHARASGASPGEIERGASRLWWVVAVLAALLAYYLVS